MNHKLPELDLLCSLGFKLFYQHSACKGVTIKRHDA